MGNIFRRNSNNDTQDDEEEEQRKRNNTGLIVGIVVAIAIIIFFALFLIGIAIWFRSPRSPEERAKYILSEKGYEPIGEEESIFNMYEEVSN